MKIWLIKLKRYDKTMTNHNQESTLYVAGNTLQGAVKSYIKDRLFYGEPVWKMEHLESAVKLPYELAGVEKS